MPTLLQAESIIWFWDDRGDCLASALIAFQIMQRPSAVDLARLRGLAEAGERRVAAQKELVEQLKARKPPMPKRLFCGL